MSIDEVMLVAEDYSMAVHDGRDADCGRLHKALRAAIEQHVAEAVERETERCVKACGAQMVQLDRLPNQTEFIRNVIVGRCIEAIRVRAEKETK